MKRGGELNTYAPLKRSGPIKRSRNKYNARRTHSALWNRVFDSGAECRYADHLYARWKNGEIDEPDFQVPVDLTIGGVKLVPWKVDFRYFEHRFCGKHTEQWVWDEVKGMELGDYKLKRKIWSAGGGPGLLRVTKERRPSKFEHWAWTEYWPADWADREDKPEPPT